MSSVAAQSCFSQTGAAGWMKMASRGYASADPTETSPNSSVNTQPKMKLQTSPPPPATAGSEWLTG